MLIYLADLCYLHDWDNNQPLPLNVGYIAAYLLKSRPDVKVEIFKDPRTLTARIAQAPPDVLALSNYDWNANLNIPVVQYARRANAATVTVLGGPNFQADDEAWMQDFFAHRQDLDLYITGEGEWSFSRLIELLAEHQGDFSKVPLSQFPATFYRFDKARSQVLHNSALPVARLDLATVPSPYLTGLMDPFLEDPRLAPIIETNRGCPYSCTFCCWGQATQSKINQFPLEAVLKEIGYLAEHCKNPTAFLYIADGNFGILSRDQAIAKAIKQCSDEHSIPKRVFMYFAKNTNEAVLNIAETLKSITSMSMSKQTMNVKVLENIKRKNIPFEQYDVLRVECKRRGIDTFCELIYGLAGESYQSYVDGVIATVREGQFVTMYPQILLAGAESNAKEYRDEHGLRTAFRVIPRYVSSYGDIHSLEYEEIVVQTNDMSRDDFYRIRLFQFLVTLLSGGTFAEFARRLDASGIDYATLASFIAQDRDNWTPQWRALLDGFIQACKSELIEKDQVKHVFTAEDIKKTQAAELWLIPFHMAKLASTAEIVSDLKSYLTRTMERGVGGLLKSDALPEIKTTLDLAFEKLVCYARPIIPKTVVHEYDFDAWLGAPDNVALSTYRLKEPAPYRYYLDNDVATAFERAKAAAADITHAVYKVRTNIIGRLSDRVFCYQRSPMSETADNREASKAQRQEIHGAHATTAVRS
ncbi:MAG: hypothetical protein HY077_13550 [Elusimicrobia bacterium]|nr:hypothetical protein [Elusimicrobiota bacterium]